ncbi:sensor histidine kinase [Aliagarivorans marinus]|uniref:sensor histidine kinase n=1 Tax=Aliagarivorans marinus TaxID=561965 RepID=UPI000417AAE9|nr:HAMP domain-containing sensor histidine kinase [Aliagarivorans marinus]
MANNEKLDFSTVLATAVHDMKNSLSMLTQTTESLARESSALGLSNSDQLSRLHYEVNRVNGSLMQLLALYRYDKQQMTLSIEEVLLDDLLVDLASNHQGLVGSLGKTLEIDVDPDLTWYCDPILLEYLLNDIVANGLRYCRNQIKLSAQIVDNKLSISVSDDGDGYPDSIIELANSEDAVTAQFLQNRSGLGLYFAKIIALAHTNNGEQGKVSLANGGELGGSVFSLCLP